MADKVDSLLLKDLAQIIEQGKKQLATQVNTTVTLVYWQIGHKINTYTLGKERAEYAKGIVSTVSTHLVAHYGKGFELRNLRRMIQFSEVFPDLEIVSTLATQLSWSHFVELLPLKSENAKLFYARRSAEENWSVRDLRNQIGRKAFERKEIANVQLTDKSEIVQINFKDPYLLDFLGLKEGYMENDLEGAILKELELFILELGKGFAFVERQKRMIIDGTDFHLDLLFYHRKLKRLVAIELKLGRFKADYKGQMELYLKWLNRYERQDGEEHPIGLILCAEKSNEQVELLEMGKDGIMVAEYWTELPPKEQLEAKLHNALLEARERLARKKIDLSINVNVENYQNIIINNWNTGITEYFNIVDIDELSFESGLRYKLKAANRTIYEITTESKLFVLVSKELYSGPVLELEVSLESINISSLIIDDETFINTFSNLEIQAKGFKSFLIIGPNQILAIFAKTQPKVFKKYNYLRFSDAAQSVNKPFL